jgi:hypothetical protein
MLWLPILQGWLVLGKAGAGIDEHKVALAVVCHSCNKRKGTSPELKKDSAL